MLKGNGFIAVSAVSAVFAAFLSACISSHPTNPADTNADISVEFIEFAHTEMSVHATVLVSNNFSTPTCLLRYKSDQAGDGFDAAWAFRRASDGARIGLRDLEEKDQFKTGGSVARDKSQQLILQSGESVALSFTAIWRVARPTVIPELVGGPIPGGLPFSPSDDLVLAVTVVPSQCDDGTAAFQGKIYPEVISWSGRFLLGNK